MSQIQDKFYISLLTFLSLCMLPEMIGRIFVKCYLELDNFFLLDIATISVLLQFGVPLLFLLRDVPFDLTLDTREFTAGFCAYIV